MLWRELHANQAGIAGLVRLICLTVRIAALAPGELLPASSLRENADEGVAQRGFGIEGERKLNRRAGAAHVDLAEIRRIDHDRLHFVVIRIRNIDLSVQPDREEEGIIEPALHNAMRRCRRQVPASGGQLDQVVGAVFSHKEVSVRIQSDAYGPPDTADHRVQLRTRRDCAADGNNLRDGVCRNVVVGDKHIILRIDPDAPGKGESPVEECAHGRGRRDLAVAVGHDLVHGRRRALIGKEDISVRIDGDALWPA